MDTTTPPTTACFRSVPCNSKSLVSFLFSPAPRHRIQVIWSPFSMKGNKPPNLHQDDLFCALGIITRLNHTIPVVRIRQYLLRLHAFENMQRMGRLGEKRKKKVWGLEISYGARDCHSLFPHQRFEGKASAWGWKSWLSCLFLTRMYIHVAVISDLVTMTIGKYKLVTMLETYSDQIVYWSHRL